MTEEEPPASAFLGAGAQLGGYTLLGARSRGAMGIVYAAVEPETGRRVAVKVLRGRALRFAHTFVRERDALLALSHPNIVSYVAHGETPEGLPYLVTEWLEGEDLETSLMRGALAVSTALAHSIAVARALGAAHAEGIVHRDVKPANIHLGADGSVKLLDFGVARVTGEATTVAMGTALYMAPEQVRAAGTVDARSDVYALGCVLFECLTGRPPFAGDRTTVVLAKAVFEPAPRVSSCGVEISPALDALVARMLSKRAEERPANGDAAAALLTACAAGDALRESARTVEVAAIAAGEEQRIACVALVRTPVVAAQAMTMADSEAPSLVARLSRLAEEYGVGVDHLLDGTLLLTAPDLEPRDQGARIARFALALVASMPGAASAIATGALGGATSSAIERAEDLLRRAAAGEVRACSATARAVEGTFALDGDLVRGVASTELDYTVVGRDATFDGLLEIVANGSTRAALVVGDAGIGKTCILHALVRHLEPSGRQTILLRAEVNRTESPLAPFARWLRGRLQLRGGAEDAARIREAVTRLFDSPLRRLLGRQTTAGDREEVESALLRVVGAASETTNDATDARERVEQGLLRFVVSEARRRGAVILVEDAQWLDTASVRLLERVINDPAATDIAVIAFGRPEASALFSSLGHTRGARIDLGPLDVSAARVLATTIAPQLEPARLDELLARAEGHPYVVRELARAARAGLTSVPDTVLGMLQARVARLPEDARRTARAAALLGMEFTTAGIERLVGEAGAAGLRTLASAGLVAIAGARCSFVSPLVRDAAYELFTNADRAALHAVAARWFDEQRDRDPAVVAWHEERGADPTRAARPHAEAAERALGLGDLELCLAHARGGIRCGAGGETLGLLRLRESAALLLSGDFGEASVRAVEATSRLVPGSVEWLTSLQLHARSCGRRADLAGLRSVWEAARAATPLDRAAQGMALDVLAQVGWWSLALGQLEEGELACRAVDELAARLELTTMERLVLHKLRANRAEQAAEWTRVTEEHERCAELANELGNRREALVAQVNHAGAMCEVGRIEEAIVLHDSLLRAVPALGTEGYLAPYARMLRGRALRMASRVDEAIDDLETALADGGHGDPRLRAQAHLELGRIALERDDLDEVVERSELAIELAPSLPQTLAHALAVRAAAHLRSGELEQAFTCSTRAMEVARTTFPSGDDPAFVLRVHVEVVLEARPHEATAAVREAYEGIVLRARRAGPEPVQASFLALSDNAAIVAHARRAGVTTTSSADA